MLKTVFRLFVAGATVFVAAQSPAARASDAVQLRRLPQVTPVEARLSASDVWVVRGQDCTTGYCNGAGLGCCDNGGLGCCDNGCASGCCDSGCCTTGCCDTGCWEDCCTGYGLNGLAELLFLRGYNTDADGDSDTDSNRYEEALRLTLGYTGPGGLGARVRWFDYDLNTTDSNFQVQTLDSEVYGNFRMGRKWFGTISGGVRYAELLEDEGEGFMDNAWGPILGIELHRVVRGNVNAYGILRESVLVGESDEDDDLAASATEIQVGLEYARCLSNGAVAYARAGIEGQHWDGWTDDDRETFGLFGGVLSVGINR